MTATSPQTAWILLASGLVFFGTGLFYRVLSIQDKKLFEFLHLKLSSLVPFFRVCWILGKTWFAIIILCVLYFSGWSSGLPATVLFAVIACVERSIKLLLKRPRPFSVLEKTRMSQPKRPKDPSHPSGDSMRIWYLAFVVPTAFSLPWPIIIVFSCIAALVSIGRIALGVHFPLDVLGGIGLGLTGAALYKLCL